MGPRAVDRTAEVAILDLWRTYHAAAFAVVGGALGCCAGSIVPAMISWPSEDNAKYEARALAELGEDCAYWVATGDLRQ